MHINDLAGTLLLQSNDLTGSIPTEIVKLSRLGTSLILNIQKCGTILNLSHHIATLYTEYLILWGNGLLNGTIPNEIGLLTNLCEFTCLYFFGAT